MPITRAIPDHKLRARADRMHDALEEIIDGLREHADEDTGIVLGPEDILRIARRALNPDEWERTA